MLRWVECALALECIWPVGAQNSGCKLHRKPLYRYSGCHKYELSALNVILGIMFKFDGQQYTVNQKIFGIEKKEEILGNVTLSKGKGKSHEVNEV